MSEIIACLVRVGDNIRKNRLIKLDGEQVTVGRSGDVNYTILSTMISRCHAIFKQHDGKWTIADNKSLNGVYVNGRQLTPFKACTMEDGDMVQFGVPTSPDTPAEFLYKYHVSLKVRIKDGAKRQKTDFGNQIENGASQNESDEDDKKRKEPVPSSSRLSEKPESVSDVERAAASSREAEYQARLAHMERLLQEKEMKQSEVEKQLENEKRERERRMKEVEELRIKEQAILLEMQDKQAKLEKEKEELKERMQAELESNLKEKEQSLISQLADQKQSLIEEKKRIEESLQEELTKALEVKNKEVEERLISMKENLERVIEKKDNDQKILEMRLNETKEENETSKLQALKAREDVLSSFVDLMEDELQCTICNELFIKATSLNCAHVFCKLCINKWMKVKKECPNCRVKITTHMQAIALDSYIEKMVEQLSDDHKEARKALLEQRKAEQDKLDAGPSAAKAPTPAPGLPPAVTNTRGRGRNRGGRNNRGGRGRNARGRGAYTTNPYTHGAQATVVTAGAQSSTTATSLLNLTGVHTNPYMRPQTTAVGRGATSTSGLLPTPPMAAYATRPHTRGATIVNTGGPNVRGAYVAGRPTTMGQPVTSTTNPIIMAVGAPPIPAGAVEATLALRSILGLPSSRTSTVTAFTVGTGQSSDSSSGPLTNSSTTSVLNPATTSSSNATSVDLSETTTNSSANPIVVSDLDIVTSTGAPIEVSDGERSSEEEEGEDDEDFLYERDRRRRRRYWMESDTEDEEERGSDEEGNNSDMSVEGVRSEYFGGYGRCYKCGRRGHWANGCPF